MEIELDDILNKIGSELIYLSIIRKKIVAKLRLCMPKLIRTIIDRKAFLNRLLTKEEIPDKTFTYLWNEIRKKINHNEGLINFQNFVRYEINHERMNYVKFMMNFFDNLMLINSAQNPADENFVKEEISDSIMSYFDTYIDSLKESYSNDLINYKNEIYFFFWTNIHMMRYNRETKKFISNENIYDYNKIDFRKNSQEEQNDINNKKEINYFDYSIAPYNKAFFHNLNFIEITIRQFKSNKIYSANYEYLLYIKFLNNYLDELEPYEIEDFSLFFIQQEEAEHIFSFMKMILDCLDKDIKDTISNEINNKVKDKDKIEEKKYSSNLLENEIDKYELIIQFITKLSADNSKMEQTMKNYLRFQYNNSQTFNFITILANILLNFTKNLLAEYI